MNKKICEKRLDLLVINIFSTDDNAHVHKNIMPMAKLDELMHEYLEYPTYSPDFNPSDYYLFRKRLSSNFSGNNERDGEKLLQDRWNKCIEVEVDYIQ